jgi:hypothetical protein
VSLYRRRVALGICLLAALHGLAFYAHASGGTGEPTSDTAPLHLEIDLAAARSRDLEFMRVAVRETSEWLYPGVIPENSAYCIEPDLLGERCLVTPHTLILQLSLDNRLEDRILDASFSLEAPDLALLESRGPTRVPGEGLFLPLAKLRYAPDARAGGPHHIEVGLLQPGEDRRVYVFVAFPEPPAAPDRLRLEFLARATDVPVEEKDFLTRITFEQDRALTIPPRDSAPGVRLSAYNAGQGGTLEIFEVTAPGLLADLPPGLRRVAPLYRFRADGLLGQYEALFPRELLQDTAEDEVVCSAGLFGGAWTVTPADPRESGMLGVGVGTNRFIGDMSDGPTRDRFVTLVVPEESAAQVEVCL